MGAVFVTWRHGGGGGGTEPLQIVAFDAVDVFGFVPLIFGLVLLHDEIVRVRGVHR